MKIDGKIYRTIWFENNAVKIIDQTKLPHQFIIKGLKTVKPDVNMHFPEHMVSLEKWTPEKPISAIYFNGAKDRYFIKRFTAGSQNTDQKFIPDGSKVQLEMISTEWKPVIEITFSKTRH